MTAITELSFLKDVSEHVMTVLREDGVYRHVRFAKPGTGIMHFDLITWPGYLAYTGDMGSYVFSRLPDMFEFFRDSRTTADGPLFVNLSYWAEKLTAQDREGVKVFSSELFEEQINDWLKDAEASDALREEVGEQVLSCSENERDAFDAAMSFTHDGKQFFQDFWEVDCTKYVYRFVWCCYALAWGVKQYDSRILTEAA